MTTWSEIIKRDQFYQVKVCRERDEDCAECLQISCRPYVTSSENEGSSAMYKPDRTARRIDASRRCLSAALVNPHQAGDAYSNFERTTAL